MQHLAPADGMPVSCMEAVYCCWLNSLLALRHYFCNGFERKQWVSTKMNNYVKTGTETSLCAVCCGFILISKLLVSKSTVVSSRVVWV